MTNNDQRGPWKRLTSRVAYENPWIQVRHEEVITPGGTEGIYGVVSMKGRAVGIIPLDEQNNTWLVRQFRYTINEPTWEIPKGSAEPKESRQQGAIRELKEETGLVASQLQTLMHIHTSISCTDETTEIFIARNMIQGPQELDETEDIVVHKVPLNRAIEMALSGEITDSISIAALLKLSSVMNGQSNHPF